MKETADVKCCVFKVFEYITKCYTLTYWLSFEIHSDKIAERNTKQNTFVVFVWFSNKTGLDK